MIKSLWMLVASLLFALMAAFARMGASDFSALELVFYRSAIVFAAGFGLAFFDEPVGLMSAAGIAVILVSGVWAAVIAKKKS